MPFPSPSVSVPTLARMQCWFNSLTYGANTGIEIQKIEGLDLPTFRTQDQDWPRTRGQSRGLDLLSGRDIVFTMDISGNPAVQAAGIDAEYASLSPLVWWKLADASGSTTAVDSSGDGYTGVATAVTFDQVGPATGTPADTAALFNGTSSVVATSSNVPADLSTGPVSLVVWFRSNNSSQPSTFLLESIDGYNLGLGVASGGFQCWIGGTGATFGYFDAADTDWHCLGVSVQGVGSPYRSIFFDGVLIGTDNSGTAGDYTGVARLAFDGSSAYFDGYLGQAAVFATQLTAADHAAIFASGPVQATAFAQTTTLAENTASLRNALSPRGTIEDPLFINVNGTTYVTLARVRKDNIPVDISYDLGGLAQNVAVQLHATDPYFYSTPTLAPLASLATPSGGYSYPLAYPLSYGGGSAGNVIPAYNQGNVECYPIFVFTGPCTYPYVSNLTTGDALYFDITLNSGDKLVVNTDIPHSAFYYQNGSTTPVSRLNVLGTSSSWWSLPPATGPNAVNGGVSTVQFNSQDTTAVAGTLEMQYASAYSSIT